MTLRARRAGNRDGGVGAQILASANDELRLLSADLPERERAEVATYWSYHRRRYSILLEDVLPRLDAVCGRPPARVLDVGPNLQTGLLRRARPAAVIDTLGFAHPFFPPRPGERHIELDLNDVRSPGAPSGDGSYDVVLMAEVIEHLHTAASLVLGHLAEWLNEKGVLIVQTPNAVALHKRLRMLAGHNPYEPIRESRENPGHFHEYTVPELVAEARPAGLSPVRWSTANYFGGSGASRLYAALGPLLPASLRHGMTLWLRRA